MDPSVVTYRHKDDTFDVISGLEACRDWIESVTKDNFSSDDFQQSTKDGILLCTLVNEICPGIVAQVNTQKSAFASRDNLQVFLTACKKLGLTDEQLFNIEDLYEGRKLRTVAVTIHWLAYVASQLNLPHIPHFDPMHLSNISLPADQKKKLIVKRPDANVAVKASLDKQPAPLSPESASGSTTALAIDEIDSMLGLLGNSPSVPVNDVVVEQPAPLSSEFVPGSTADAVGEIDSMLADFGTPKPTPIVNEAPNQDVEKAAVYHSSNPSPSSSLIPDNLNPVNIPPNDKPQQNNVPGEGRNAPNQTERPQWNDPPTQGHNDLPNQTGIPLLNETPTQGRNAPNQTGRPQWNDPPTQGHNDTPNQGVRPKWNEPSTQGKNTPQNQTERPQWNDPPTRGKNDPPKQGERPQWNDEKPTVVTNPNLAQCDDCRLSILLGQTAFSHGNGTFCLDCLCGMCGNPFRGSKKNRGPSASSRNYCPTCVCHRCSVPISASYVPDGDWKMCLNCCCEFCKTPLSDSDVPPLCNNCKCAYCNAGLNGRYYTSASGSRCCENCIHDVNKEQQLAPPSNRPPCKKCGNPTTGRVIETSAGLYHEQCFSCVDCGNVAIHILSGNPYCAACHPDKAICCVCGEGLRGGGLEALQLLYHDHCFTCQRCNNPLPGGKYKELKGFALCSVCASSVNQ